MLTIFLSQLCGVLFIVLRFCCDLDCEYIISTVNTYTRIENEVTQQQIVEKTVPPIVRFRVGDSTGWGVGQTRSKINETAK